MRKKRATGKSPTLSKPYGTGKGVNTESIKAAVDKLLDATGGAPETQQPGDTGEAGGNPMPGFDIADAMRRGSFKVLRGKEALEFMKGAGLGSSLDAILGRGDTAAVTCPISAVLREVHDEAHRAMAKHSPMHSAHEGISVIREELDELWDEVKADRGYQQSAREEAIQIAAMAVRYILDVCDADRG